MKISILPKTLLGKWSGYLAIAFILAILLVFSYTVFNLITLPFILFTILSIFSFISGPGRFVIGLISILKSGERSILVFVAMAIGLYSLVGSTTALLGLQM